MIPRMPRSRIGHARAHNGHHRGHALVIKTEQAYRICMDNTEPKRIQQRRTRGWRKPENTVGVARPGRWGNPYNIPIFGLDVSLALFRNTARGVWNPNVLDQGMPDAYWDAAYVRHGSWLKRLGGHPLELARAELAGKNLMCFCPLDQPCHADVLLEIANRH